MTRAGRKPLGPALVGHLEGSQRAKTRLEVILQTIAGELTISEACERLGIKEAMFHRLRTEVLEAGLARLEPRPLGRRPRVVSAAEARCAELQQQVGELESELKIATVREEIAHVLPHLAGDDDRSGVRNSAVKKTTARNPRKKRKPNRRRKAR